MRDSMKMTIPYQFGMILLSQVGAVVVGFTFQMVAFYAYLETPIIREILGTVFTIVFAAMVYSRSYKLSVADHRPYTRLKPSIVKGALFGVMLSVIMLLMAVLLHFVWQNYSNEEGLIGFFPHAVHMLFSVWTSPFVAFMGKNKDYITAAARICMYVVPVIASTAGYIAGKHKFNIMEKMMNSVYEKNDDE